MDSEDEKWLNELNNSRKKDGLNQLTEDDFEFMIDRLEKEAFKHVSGGFFGVYVLLSCGHVFNVYH